MAKQEDWILVVDDESYVLEIVSDCLKDEGFSCDVASSGEEALKKVPSHDPPYSLVLTDHDMPGIKGTEVIKKINLQYPETTVIMLTANRDIKIAVEALKLGAYDYISKPFDLDDLVYSVKRTLRHRKLELEAKEYEKQLEERVQERTAQVIHQMKKNREALDTALEILVKLKEEKNKFSEDFDQKIKGLASGVAGIVNLSEEERKNFLKNFS